MCSIPVLTLRDLTALSDADKSVVLQLVGIIEPTVTGIANAIVQLPNIARSASVPPPNLNVMDADMMGMNITQLVQSTPEVLRHLANVTGDIV
ncbi:hypothetical protein D9756_011046 [Leucocoprinus leucothites]|uniref:Uncharacterized protein n=1 Tax=Leucocoprinus leucothites TaxID=201217 RepID=A0A8H5FQN1_9AGAR|nr:hypothetical protein D9756_011046 [Leucoagaricus leucothites]